MSFFDKTRDAEFKKACEKAINLAIDYFSRLIKIVPKSAKDMSWTYSNTNCGEAIIPPDDRKTGKSSDLHLYITFTVAPNDTYLAYAGWCKMVKKLGPTHG